MPKQWDNSTLTQSTDYYDFTNGRIIFEAIGLVQLIIYSTPKPPENILYYLRVIRGYFLAGKSLLDIPIPNISCYKVSNCFS
jgi:hypothetical protein